MDTDAELMCRARDGDPDAFGELFNRWRVPMVRFAVRFIGDQARGEELAQDVFLKIYRARHRYEPREAFRAYIFKVATNHCINQKNRAENRRPKVAVEDLRVEPMDQRRPDATELVHAEALRRQVRAAVAELPPKQRAALLLQKEDGLGYQEIADALSTSVSAVKSLLNRARNALLRDLEPLLDRPQMAGGRS
jgi:RNA polymerase sigma-70 factor (ECF subfamily)